MTPLRKDLLGMKKDLVFLLQRTTEMEEMLSTLETALGTEQPKSRPRALKVKAKAGRKRLAEKAPKEKAGKVTATDAVLNTILKSGKGLTTAQIKKKTGFDEKKIWNIINRGKRLGKIKSERQGVYVKT